MNLSENAEKYSKECEERIAKLGFRSRLGCEIEAFLDEEQYQHTSNGQKALNRYTLEGSVEGANFLNRYTQRLSDAEQKLHEAFSEQDNDKYPLLLTYLTSKNPIYFDANEEINSTHFKTISDYFRKIDEVINNLWNQEPAKVYSDKKLNEFLKPLDALLEEYRVANVENAIYASDGRLISYSTTADINPETVREKIIKSLRKGGLDATIDDLQADIMTRPDSSDLVTKVGNQLRECYKNIKESDPYEKMGEVKDFIIEKHIAYHKDQSSWIEGSKDIGQKLAYLYSGDVIATVLPIVTEQIEERDIEAIMGKPFNNLDPELKQAISQFRITAMSDAKDAFLDEVGSIDRSGRHYEEAKSYRETGFNQIEVTSKPFPLSQSATVLTELIQDISTAAGNIGMAANFSPVPQPGHACDITDHSYSTTGIKTNGIHFHQSIDRINGQSYENFFQRDHEHIQDPSEKKRQTRLDAISHNIFQDSYVLFLSEAGDLTAYNEHSLERRTHNKVVPKEWKHSTNKNWGAAIREVEDDKQGLRIESRFYDTLMNPNIISPIISAATLYALEQTLVYTEFPIPVNQEFVDALKMNDGALNLKTLKENYSSVLQDCLNKIDGLSDSQAVDYPDRQQIAALPLFLEYIRPSHENNDKNLLREKIEKYKVEVEQRYDQLITAQQAHPDLHGKESLSRQEFAVLLQETGSMIDNQMLDKISKGAIKGHHEISSGYMKKISVPMTDERQVAIDRFTKGHIAQHYFPDELKDQILAEVSHIRSPHNFVSTIGLQYDKGISSSKIEGLNI